MLFLFDVMIEIRDVSNCFVEYCMYDNKNDEDDRIFLPVASNLQLLFLDDNCSKQTFQT